MPVRVMPISDLRRNASEALAVIRDGDPIYITHHGRPAAVLIDFEQYETLLDRLEERPDPATLSTEDTAALIDELDQLATEIGTSWPERVSAVDAVRDVRRAL